MSSFKLVLKNVCKNFQDYLIYFLTLIISVSLFYAFNSISNQPAFSDMGMSKTFLYDQLGTLISVLSVLIAAVLAFLIIYANQFLLKRRKKELGIYIMLGMKKGRISRVFAGETLCVGAISLVVGLILGFALSQGLSLISLKLFAIELSKFQLVFSSSAFSKTVMCFIIIFSIVMIFNVWSVSSVKLIDLLTANRKNESLKVTNRVLPLILFIVSLGCIICAGILISKNGILPSRENMSFQIAGVALIAGTFLFFYSLSAVLVQAAQANKEFYLKKLNVFLVRQIGSKVCTNYFILAIVCGLLTITISAVSIGVSTALAMNELSAAAAPYDLNIVSDIEKDGDSDIATYLASQDMNIDQYSEKQTQISLYEADITYGEFFAGQEVELWSIDEMLPTNNVSVISISDFNKALALQGKEPISLEENQFLMNCNYKGTLQYIQNALQNNQTLTIAGVPLQSASDKILNETYFMTSVGNNDRGTLVLHDVMVEKIAKDINVLLVQYKPDVNSDEVIQKMLPIGLDETHGYRYAEKSMMYDMFYGTNALVTFLCCYIGLIFLLICAAILALKQLTETTDNIYRYGLLQRLGANQRQVNRTLLSQTAVFFVVPLIVAGGFSVFLMREAMVIVEGFMNIHISTNMVFTVVLFLVVYGSYFLATYLSCKRMVVEQQTNRMEV